MNRPLSQTMKQAASWLHAVLLLAILIPLLHAMWADGSEPVSETLYVRCLVIAVPIVLTDLAAMRCRGLLAYLASCALILAATAALGFLAAGPLRHGAFFGGYILPLLCEAVLISVSRLTERIDRKKEEEAVKNEDPSWRPVHHTLREPDFLALVYFLAVYALALNLNSPAVCDAALFSAIAYIPVTFLYRYLDETEHYLLLNKRTCSLPSRRIYGIGSGMLALFLLLFLVTILPALFTISSRHYHDLREWRADIVPDSTVLFPEQEAEYAGEDFMTALAAEYGEAKPTPQWLIFLSYVLEAAVLLFLAAALLKKIRETFRTFRGTDDENGDVVEELEETPEETHRIAARAGSRGLSERERIRREYRRTIRRHRKDRPAVYESPAEIEANAGIGGTEESRELHAHYELARYGREE